jgi:predicted DNA repair protein MutK
MASGFFALLDDIAALMDDVAAMTKVSTQKTAGILGDDLAVNAEKASGFRPSRELPVLWAISKGSFLNKLIILPLAFLLSAFLPWMVTVVLVLGALFLAYEGAEKIYEFLIPHAPKIDTSEEAEALQDNDITREKKKIKSAILTDFILSVEIVIIALGTVIDESLTFQILVVSIVAIIATVGVYGIVALIVRMDDLGLRLLTLDKGKQGLFFILGNVLIKTLPLIIKGLSVVGTIALLLVAGGIFAHKIDVLHGIFESWPAIFREFVFGLVAGMGCLLVLHPLKWLFKKLNS